MEQFLAENWWVILLLSLWTIPWKGVALWKAARARSVVWFVILMVVNTMGILEIIYIFLFAKKREAKNTPVQG
jgi:methionyl-tRNA synthetase